MLWHACIISLESSVPSRPIIELYNIAHTEGCIWSDSAWKAVECECVGILFSNIFYNVGILIKAQSSYLNCNMFNNKVYLNI